MAKLALSASAFSANTTNPAYLLTTPPLFHLHTPTSLSVPTSNHVPASPPLIHHNTINTVPLARRA